jgi:hypothetical protein
MTTDMNQVQELPNDGAGVAYCLDMCGNVLVTPHELVGGICLQCLTGVHFCDWTTSIWEMEPTAAFEDEDGIDEDEKLCILINEGLASIWPSPVF